MKKQVAICGRRHFTMKHLLLVNSTWMTGLCLFLSCSAMVVVNCLSTHVERELFSSFETRFLKILLLNFSFIFTSTQRNAETPVVFTGLSETARITTTFDDEEKQMVCSTANPGENYFDLLSSDNEKEEPIPSTQPRYHLQDMWW